MSTIVESTTLETLAAGYSALSDPIRLRILGALSPGQRCVCELLTEVEVAPNLLSYHLRVLRDAGLVEASRRGRWMDYRLAPTGLEALRRAIPGEDSR